MVLPPSAKVLSTKFLYVHGFLCPAHNRYSNRRKSFIHKMLSYNQFAKVESFRLYSIYTQTRRFSFLTDMKSKAYRPVETRHRRVSMLLPGGDSGSTLTVNGKLSPTKAGPKKQPPPVRPRVKVHS